MARTLRWISTMLAASVLACAADKPLAPDPVPEKGGLASLSAADVASGTRTVSFDAVLYWDCLGEMVHNVFEVSYDYTLVLLSNGEYVYRELWPSGTGIGTLTGLTTGTVWRRDLQASPYVERSTGGGMMMWTAKVRFVNETGAIIDVREEFHLSRNANGDITVDHYEFDCKLR